MLKVRWLIPALAVLSLALMFCASCAGNAGVRGENGDPPRQEPAWVSDVEQSYSRLRYVAAVGYGSGRAVAEKEAFAALISVFGQTVRVDRQSIVGYQEALQQNTVSSYLRNTEVNNAIQTSAELDTLIGAEIRDYWYDGRGTHYAVAVMEKSRAASLYAELVRANREIVETLTLMDEDEKNSLNGYARYHLAAKVADGNRVFANILSVLGGQGPSAREMALPENFRLEADAIRRRIPIDIQVENDQANRIKGAFAAIIGGNGFQSGGDSSRYVLDGKLSFTPVDLPGQDNEYVRYVLEAGLVDRRTGVVLLPYTISGREGHLTVQEAENRAIRSIEREIAATWDTVFSAYLDSLTPGER